MNVFRNNILSYKFEGVYVCTYVCINVCMHINIILFGNMYILVANKFYIWDE